MAYQLKSQESVSTGIKRIADEQLDKALYQLTGKAGTTQAEAVHESRKRLKQIRAVLRLIRDEIGLETYRRENIAFRDAARLMSDVRDAQVRVETIDKLTAHFSDSIAPNEFAKIRQALAASQQSAYEPGLDQQNDSIAPAIKMIEKARQRIEHWSFLHTGWAALRKGFKRIYQQGQTAFELACQEKTAHNWHEWRKRVKDLWYHLKILQPIWTDVIGELINQTHRLADCLGDDHDLAMLQEFMATQPKQFKDRSKVDRLNALIDRRRNQLQAKAMLLGQRIYAEDADAFVKRIGTYWRIWQAETKDVSRKEGRGKIPVSGSGEGGS
jgi:CHAD domain-containing protein